MYESGEAGLWGIESRRGPKCYEGSKSTKQPRYVMVEFMFVGVTNVGSSVYPVVSRCVHMYEIKSVTGQDDFTHAMWEPESMQSGKTSLH